MNHIIHNTGWSHFDCWCQEEWYRLSNDPLNYKPRCMWARKKKRLRHSRLCECHPKAGDK